MHREHCIGEAPPEAARAALGEQALARLFPSGLTIVKASPTAEAGQRGARRAAPRRGAIDRRVPGGDPGVGQDDAAPQDAAMDRGGQGAPGDRAQAGRVRHRGEDGAGDQGDDRRDAQPGFRVVSAVLSNLELSGAAAEAIETIRGPARKASERAGERCGGAGNAPGPG
ncbi:hypothetical protein WME79_37795 [Sorangium sp. So ce726]|uniref:hypothetical protein n=1 Tax=Sorangium sp. So ce726 TaxID=3133319 RepID=UPI003F62A60A